MSTEYFELTIAHFLRACTFYNKLPFFDFSNFIKIKFFVLVKIKSMNFLKMKPPMISLKIIGRQCKLCFIESVSNQAKKSKYIIENLGAPF